MLKREARDAVLYARIKPSVLFTICKQMDKLGYKRKSEFIEAVFSDPKGIIIDDRNSKKLPRRRQKPGGR